jgi:hypothetical protein
MEELKTFGQLAFWLVSSVGITVAALTYFFNLRLKQAEWLKSLFEKFYESVNYKEVRRWIDFNRIEEELNDDEDGTKEEKFADFLNFFEFIAILEKLKQLNISKIRDLFSYYLKLIDNNSYCRNYIKEHGYKNLAKFLEKYDF